ncbi:MAG: polyprenyl synthetase family protein [Cytophagales bacterium]
MTKLYELLLIFAVLTIALLTNNKIASRTLNFKAALEKINAEIANLPLDQNPKELYQPVSYFMGLGGKRMRPLLTLLGCYLFEEDIEKAVKPSVAVELFHNFSLIHDDIMDKAPLRRGMPTIHEKWNANIAILAGDITLIQAYELLAFVDTDIRAEIYQLFNRTAKEVCEGQQIDMNFETQSQVSIEDYIRMISLKTAVLLGFSMYLGARIGGASASESQKIYNAALNMGISFQIKDDLLDVFGDANKVGKRVGGDIVSNKKTYLLLKAFEKANETQKAKLDELIGNSFITETEKVSEVIGIYNQLNIRQISQDAIEIYFKKALQNLESIDANSERKSFLKNYFTDVLHRES